MSEQFAIDTSHWRRINFDELPETVTLIITKATEGIDFVDETLEEVAEGCAQTGRHLGVFHYIRSQIPWDDQLEHYLETTRPFREHIKIDALDLEITNNDPTINHLWIKGWMEGLRQQVQSTRLLYTNANSWSFFNMANISNAWRGPLWMADTELFKLWVADWTLPVNFPRPFTSFWLHQYTDKLQVPGIYSDVAKTKPIGVDANISAPELWDAIAGVAPPPPELDINAEIRQKADQVIELAEEIKRLTE